MIAVTRNLALVRHGPIPAAAINLPNISLTFTMKHHRPVTRVMKGKIACEPPWKIQIIEISFSGLAVLSP